MGFVEVKILWGDISMAPIDVAARNERVTASLNTMLAKESPTGPADRVDILSGSDHEAVTFTSAWETEG